MKLREVDLFDYNKLIMSRYAPTEKRFFRDDEDKFIRYTVRLGNCWSVKECKSKTKSVYRSVIKNIDKSLKLNIETALTYLDEEDLQMKVIKICIEKLLTKEEIKEYVPAIQRIKI